MHKYRYKQINMQNYILVDKYMKKEVHRHIQRKVGKGMQDIFKEQWQLNTNSWVKIKKLGIIIHIELHNTDYKIE